MRVGYEEKSFEIYFNMDLERRGEICFPFGQVQEGIICADAAAMVRKRELIALFGMIPSAIKVGEDISEICKTAESIAREHINGDLPAMCANILFQYKRPHYISNSLGTESAFWSYAPYYRYRVDTPKNQLKRLLDITAMHDSKCEVVYAAPAIRTANELFEIHTNRQILENTNYVLADKLKGHSKYTYATPGSGGVAFSDPHRIESINLMELLHTIRRQWWDRNEHWYDKEQNSRLVIELASGLNRVLHWPEVTARQLNDFDIDVRENYLGLVSKYPLVEAMLTMFSISTKYRFQWGIVIAER